MLLLTVPTPHPQASSMSPLGTERGSTLSRRCHHVLGIAPPIQELLLGWDHVPGLLKLRPYPSANRHSEGSPGVLCYVYVPDGTHAEIPLQEISEMPAKISPLSKRPFSERGDPRQSSSSLASMFREWHSINRLPLRGKILLPSLIPSTLDGGVLKSPHHSCFPAASGKN